MIVDRIDRRDVYNNFVPNWKEAFDFALSLKDAEPGRYECESLPAGTAFALVQEGHTRPYEEGKLEAHRRYMDVQIFLKGGEVVYYTDIDLSLIHIWWHFFFQNLHSCNGDSDSHRGERQSNNLPHTGQPDVDPAAGKRWYNDSA